MAECVITVGANVMGSEMRTRLGGCSYPLV